MPDKKVILVAKDKVCFELPENVALLSDVLKDACGLVAERVCLPLASPGQ